jgi:hypothetical protein
MPLRYYILLVALVAEKLHNIKVREGQYRQLIKLQGFFQMKEGVMYSMADILDMLLEAFPEQEANLDDNMFSIGKDNGVEKK